MAVSKYLILGAFLVGSVALAACGPEDDLVERAKHHPSTADQYKACLAGNPVTPEKCDSIRRTL
jgi:hypothetical protein